MGSGEKVGEMVPWSGVPAGKFFDLLVDVRAVFNPVPVILTHAHEKVTGRALEPDFVFIRLFGMKIVFSAFGTHVRTSHLSHSFKGI